jgi:hypothetical protein
MNLQRLAEIEAIKEENSSFDDTEEVRHLEASISMLHLVLPEPLVECMHCGEPVMLEAAVPAKHGIGFHHEGCADLA